MIVYNNQEPNAVSNVGQFGATEGSIGAYKQAAEYAADAKYWALLAESKFGTVDDLIMEVERLYQQGVLMREDIEALKQDFKDQDVRLMQLISQSNAAVANANNAIALINQKLVEVDKQLDILLGMTVEVTTLPPGSQATGSFDPTTGEISLGIPEGFPGKDGSVKDLDSAPVGTPELGDLGFYVDKDDNTVHKTSLENIANLIPSVRDISLNGGEPRSGNVSLIVDKNTVGLPNVENVASYSKAVSDNKLGGFVKTYESKALAEADIPNRQIGETILVWNNTSYVFYEVAPDLSLSLKKEEPRIVTVNSRIPDSTGNIDITIPTGNPSLYLGEMVMFPYDPNLPVSYPGILPADGRVVSKAAAGDLGPSLISGQLPVVSESQWQNGSRQYFSWGTLEDGSDANSTNYREIRLPDWTGGEAIRSPDVSKDSSYSGAPLSQVPYIVSVNNITPDDSTGNISITRSSLGAAKSGDNSDITSLSGLTTPISIAQGGLGVTTQEEAWNVVRPAGPTTLSAAAVGEMDAVTKGYVDLIKSDVDYLKSLPSLIDISKIDGVRNSDMLNSFFSSIKGGTAKVFSSVPLTFTIDKTTTLYGSFDLSNCTFNLTGGRVIYADERDPDSCLKVITLSGYPLQESSKVLTTNDSLQGWDNSLVKITSTEIDLYRYLNGVSTPKTKGEVNFLTKNKELMYSLKNTYNDPVSCTLYKIPLTRNQISLPKIEGSINTFAFDIRRSLVDVNIIMDSSIGQTSVDSTVFGSGFTFGVVWKIIGSGVTQTDNNSRYSVTTEFALKHLFTSSLVGKGWRSVDGNYSRDMTFRDSTFDSIQMHYGCSSILISGCEVPSVLFGTGAFGETTQVVNSDISTFGIRTDYGEHKGDFYVTGGSIRIPSTSSGIVDLFICRSDNINSSGEPLQPRPLHLPKNVKISSNIYWPDSVTLNLVSLKNNFKTTDTNKFITPSLIDFSGSTFNGKLARFEFAQAYYDYETMTPFKIKITPSSASGCTLQAYIGYLTEASSSRYELEIMNVRTSFMNISSSSSNSCLDVSKAVVNRFSGYSGSLRFAGRFSFNECIFDWDSSNNFVGGYSSVTNSIIDGRKIETSTGTRPIINTFLHRSQGNIALRAIATDSRDVVDKRRAFCPRSDEVGNFNIGEIELSY